MRHSKHLTWRAIPPVLALCVLASCQSATGMIRPAMRMDAVNTAVLPQPEGPGQVTVALNGDFLDRLRAAGDRQLLATVADIEFVTIVVSPTGYAEVSQTVQRAQLAAGTGTISFTSLPSVSTKITITAFDVNGRSIGKGAQTTVVSSQGVTTVNFSVQLDPTYITTPVGVIAGNVTFTDGPVVNSTPPPGTQPKSGDVAMTLKVAGNPEAIAFDPTGRPWITGFSGNTINRFTAAGAVVDVIKLPIGTLPSAIAFDATGNAWVANYQTGNVTKRRQLDGGVIGTYPVGPYPTDLAFDKTGNLWVPSYFGGNVVKLLAQGIPAGAFFLEPNPALAIKTNPIAVATDATSVYVVGLKAQSVTKFSLLGAKLGSFKVGLEPEDIAIDATGALWVPNNGANTVTKLSATGVVLGTFATGKRPRGITFDKVGNAWIANYDDDTVSKISPTGATLGTFKVGNGPRTMATDSAGGIWVLNYDANTAMKLVP